MLNGIDYEEWNPATDRYLGTHYDAGNLGGKVTCKTALQRQLGLPEAPAGSALRVGLPAGRGKGLDLLSECLPHLLELDVQFVLLGTGEAYYEERMRVLAHQYPTKMAAVIGFDNALADRIYAGSDFFVMPSHYEPCGLGQLISLRYGTIPVVRHTGGLADTISNFDPKTGRATDSRSRIPPRWLCSGPSVVPAACREATAWSRLAENALACDFSWGRSAEAIRGPLSTRPREASEVTHGDLPAHGRYRQLSLARHVGGQGRVNGAVLPAAWISRRTCERACRPSTSSARGRRAICPGPSSRPVARQHYLDRANVVETELHHRPTGLTLRLTDLVVPERAGVVRHFEATNQGSRVLRGKLFQYLAFQLGESPLKNAIHVHAEEEAGPLSAPPDFRPGQRRDGRFHLRPGHGRQPQLRQAPDGRGTLWRLEDEIGAVDLRRRVESFARTGRAGRAHFRARRG